MKKTLYTFVTVFYGFISCAIAQDKPAIGPRKSPVDIPGDGIAAHDFFYAGEGNKVMSIVKSGKIVWTYTDTTKRGEISDAVMLSNGNILFAHQFGITEITKDKKLVWNYDAPAGAEIHTAEPIGKNKVLYVQNGNPAKMIVVDITSGKKEFEMDLKVGNPLSVHGQVRHASITPTGTVLVAHMDANKVCEYSGKGDIIWSVDVPSPWNVERLKNGHTLISSNNKFVREVDNTGKTIWEFEPGDLPDYKFSGFQRAIRLANGNTLIGNWAAKGDGTEVQAIEVNADKKLVWALRSWNEPENLGRSTNIQILDGRPTAAENVHFGDIR